MTMTRRRHWARGHPPASHRPQGGGGTRAPFSRPKTTRARARVGACVAPIAWGRLAYLSEGHWQHRVPVIINVFADEIDTAATNNNVHRLAAPPPPSWARRFHPIAPAEAAGSAPPPPRRDPRRPT